MAKHLIDKYSHGALRELFLVVLLLSFSSVNPHAKLTLCRQLGLLEDKDFLGEIAELVHLMQEEGMRR